MDEPIMPKLGYTIKNRRSKYQVGNFRTMYTGDGLKQLQKNMSQIRPSKAVGLQLSDLFDDITCVRCGDLPIPPNIMACDSGHYTCVNCAFTGQKKEVLNSEGKVRVLQDCCDTRKLRKEPAHVLRALLNKTQFTCPNKEKGCKVTVVGLDNYVEHRVNCNLTVKYTCRFFNCTEDFLTVTDLLYHYIIKHDGCVLDASSGPMTLPISFKETTESRLCALLLVKKYHFVFACEIRDEILFIWVWALEHEPGTMGKKTQIKYNLKLTQIRNESPEENADQLRLHTGHCLFHQIDPEDIISKRAWLVNPYKCDVNTFKRLFVEPTYDGEGQWIVSVEVLVEDEED